MDPMTYKPLKVNTRPMLTIEPCWFNTGYSSHGKKTTFKDIWLTESERGNAPFIFWREDAVERYADWPAIWVTTKAIEAFRYTVFAEERENTDLVLQSMYPDWMDDVCSVDCSRQANAYVFRHTYDGDNGFVVVFRPST